MWVVQLMYDQIFIESKHKTRKKAYSKAGNHAKLAMLFIEKHPNHKVDIIIDIYDPEGKIVSRGKIQH